MKLELKKQTFQKIGQYLIDNADSLPFSAEISAEIVPQFNEYFKKYNEIQKFKLREKVVIGAHKPTALIGRISKVVQRSNGRWYYKVKYMEIDYSYDQEQEYETESNFLTSKNLSKI